METQKSALYQSGAYIYIEDDAKADLIYLVESGEIELKTGEGETEVYQRVARQGDIFGFISAFAERPRMETARALKETRLTAFPRDAFLALLRSKRDIALKIINIFADRLRNYNQLVFPHGEIADCTPENVRMLELALYYMHEKAWENAFYVLARFLKLYPECEQRTKAEGMLKTVAGTGVTKAPVPRVEGYHRIYKDKQIIFCEGEPGRELFIIKTGKVGIVKHHHGREILLALLKADDIFGELAIASDKPRNATAISFGETVLIPVDRESLFTLFTDSPNMLQRIYTAICQRIWFTFNRLDIKLYRRPQTRIYAFLEDKLIEERISLESDQPHIFDFSLDALLMMIDLGGMRQDAQEIREIFSDPNLELKFGQIRVNNIAQLSAKANYYKKIDR